MKGNETEHRGESSKLVAERGIVKVEEQGDGM